MITNSLVLLTAFFNPCTLKTSTSTIMFCCSEHNTKYQCYEISSYCQREETLLGNTKLSELRNYGRKLREGFNKKIILFMEFSIMGRPPPVMKKTHFSDAWFSTRDFRNPSKCLKLVTSQIDIDFFKPPSSLFVNLWYSIS